MCSYCLSNPCKPGCPNAEDPEPVYECSICGEGIYEGEDFFDGPDGYICKDCLKDMTSFEVIELFGESLKTA